LATLIHPDGKEEKVFPEKKKKWSLEELQKHVGGYIQMVPGPKRTILVNEDGILLRLPLNRNGTEAARVLSPRQHSRHTLYGPVLILDVGERM
jgi:hypothetical protein